MNAPRTLSCTGLSQNSFSYFDISILCLKTVLSVLHSLFPINPYTSFPAPRAWFLENIQSFRGWRIFSLENSQLFHTRKVSVFRVVRHRCLGNLCEDLHIGLCTICVVMVLEDTSLHVQA